MSSWRELTLSQIEVEHNSSMFGKWLQKKESLELWLFLSDNRRNRPQLKDCVTKYSISDGARQLQDFG